jgi:DNA-binding MarR family transcriptional regulator
MEFSAARLSVLAGVTELGPLRPTVLAGHLHLDISVVSRQLSSLDRDALVERVTDPVDGRAQLVRVTGAGRLLLGELRQRASERLAQRLAGWSDEDLDALTALLRRLEESVAAAEGGELTPEILKGVTV